MNGMSSLVYRRASASRRRLMQSTSSVNSSDSKARIHSQSPSPKPLVVWRGCRGTPDPSHRAPAAGGLAFSCRLGTSRLWAAVERKSGWSLARWSLSSDGLGNRTSHLGHCRTLFMTFLSVGARAGGGGPPARGSLLGHDHLAAHLLGVQRALVIKLSGLIEADARGLADRKIVSLVAPG